MEGKHSSNDSLDSNNDENKFCERIEYDLVDYELENEECLKPVSAVKLNDLVTDGVTFEVQDPDECESSQMPYWTRDEIIANLESNPFPFNDDLNELSGTFDERIAHMTEIEANNVYKRILREGSGETIGENSAVLYHLNAYLEGQDEPFDSTWLRGRPYLHRLNQDTVIKGVYYGLKTMKKGERCELIVRPDYAYLSMGCPPRIPENSTILYTIEVINIMVEGSLAHYETLSPEEKLKVNFETIYKLCDEERISGNSYYKVERFRDAAFRYRRAIRNLDLMMYQSSEDEAKAKTLLLSLFCNIANAFLKLQRPMTTMMYCKRALEIDANSVKALYHYGCAKMANGDNDAALVLLKKALALKPQNKQIIEALKKLDMRMVSDKINEQDLYRRMSAFVTHKSND